MLRPNLLPGRTLTSQLVGVIAVVTSVCVLMVVLALAWALQRTNPDGLSSQIAAAAVLFGFTAVVLASLVAWRLGREISRPVVVMARTMRRMAEGDLEVEAPRTHTATELGDMAQALEAFRANARQRLEAEAGRRAAEKTAQDRSDFLAVMSHEIRTPMNGVLGMAEALAHTPLTAAQKDMLAVLTASGGNLMSLLNDVLDYAKLESGRLEIERISFELGKLVEDTAALFRPEAEGKRVSLSVSLPPELPAVLGDPGRIRQVLHNLLSNAVKFTEAGRIAVVLEMRPGEHGGVEARLAVHDTGIGISAVTQGRLFQKFVQGDVSTTRVYGGSGLGLAISRELARLMGGDVTLVSEAGVGSCFTLVLPMRPAPAVGEPAAEITAIPALTAGRLRILVAEDNPANRQVLGLTLEMIGAEVTFAFNGAEAVEAWSAGAYDLILMDVQMPVLDGLDATRQLREMERTGEVRRAPVVAVTANAMPHHVQECLAAGMDAHVAKPIRPHELFAAIDQVLAGGGASEVSAAA